MKDDTQENKEIEDVQPEPALSDDPSGGELESTVDDVSFEELNEDGDPVGQVKKLKEKLKKALAERQEYLDGWQRERADFANFKKEELVRKNALMGHASEKFILDLMPVLDAFDMAMGNKEAWEKADKNWRTGVEYIYNQLVGVLEKHNVTQIGSVGLPFDPMMHESMETVPTEQKELSHTIEKVIQKGYKLGDRIIRPARVRVWEGK